MRGQPAVVSVQGAAKRLATSAGVGAVEVRVIRLRLTESPVVDDGVGMRIDSVVRLKEHRARSAVLNPDDATCFVGYRHMIWHMYTWAEARRNGLYHSLSQNPQLPQ